MVLFYYKSENNILQSSDLKVLNSLGYEDIVWIDLNDPLGKEKRAIEAFLNTELQTRAQAEEIESSSRYFETDDIVYGNTNFLLSQGDGYVEEPVSFTICGGILIVSRNTDLRTLSEVGRKLMNSHSLYITGYHLLISILENRIDLDADMIEGIAKEITQLTRKIVINQVEKETLVYLSQLQENIMIIRENIIDKQRTLSSILKSNLFPSDIQSKVMVMINDVNSLLNHADFGFERLEYLQNTVLGLINVEQNKIIKIFTITSVVFMPPTLIASIYGMNFNVMPETQWKFGYLFSIILMLLSAGITLYAFKRKKLL
ncbi:MAG: magnesium and cobalt transport protein CorA [Prevotellaceae bacterium]|jgi:magnesium transporter|nr:magnesium and cobalt transport protein CorA [Prevotellaceae bacterium]